MAVKSKRWTRAEARGVVDELEASGLSITAFSQRRGLSYERVRKWRARLRREEVAELPRLVELVPQRPQPAGKLTLCCPSGHRLELGEVELDAGLRLVLLALAELDPC